MSKEIKCCWSEDTDGNWETDCDGIFVLEYGTPLQNEMKFCCYCGKILEETSLKKQGVNEWNN